MKIAIIGGGFSGCNIYNLLKKDHHDITIFEKSRGVGGRCSTRYIEQKLLDHGTPFFKSDDKEFLEFCQNKVNEHILIKRGNTYYPTNGINKICSSLIDEKDLATNTQINLAKFIHNKWILKDQNGITYENFDRLIITIPAPQILQMNIDISNDTKDKLSKVRYDSIATLIVYSNSYENLENPNLLKSDSFKKIVNNSSKYNYSNFSSYILHLNEKLSNQQNFISKNEVEKYMVKKVFDIASIDLNEDFHIVPHLWRYAIVSESLDEEFIYEDKIYLGICGDYFSKKNLEGSFLSAKRLYEQNFR